MRSRRWITCLWPGLAALWWRGSLLGLLAAAAFAALLNLAVFASFIWPELFGFGTPRLGWLALAAIWGGAVLRNVRLLRDSPRRDLGDVDLFVQAQAEYLRGRWVEAERIWMQCLRRRCDEADARLMLATLYRHTGRRAEAEEQLGRLERLDAGDRWRFEIGRERDLLGSVSAEGSEEKEPEQHSLKQQAPREHGAREDVADGRDTDGRADEDRGTTRAAA